jgi:hypothetical protein
MSHNKARRLSVEIATSAGSLRVSRQWVRRPTTPAEIHALQGPMAGMLNEHAPQVAAVVAALGELLRTIASVLPEYDVVAGALREWDFDDDDTGPGARDRATAFMLRGSKGALGAPERAVVEDDSDSPVPAALGAFAGHVSAFRTPVQYSAVDRALRAVWLARCAVEAEFAAKTPLLTDAWAGPDAIGPSIVGDVCDVLAAAIAEMPKTASRAEVLEHATRALTARLAMLIDLFLLLCVPISVPKLAR